MVRNSITCFGIFLWCLGMMMASCSSDDGKDQQPISPETLVGEWIVEIQADDIMLEDSDEEWETLADGYTVALIYHFFADGSCWKEIDVMGEGRMVYQPVSRYDTDECKYSVDAKGNVIIEYKDSEESDVLLFDGTRLSDEYDGERLYLSQATAEQSQLYKDESDAWHGGADDYQRYDVAAFKPKGVDNSRWMKTLKDSRLVADLSLPGSHDACTAEGWHNEIIAFVFEMSAKCQDLTIQEQLKVGVRAFDLRPERDLDGKNYVLRCSHGIAPTKMYVRDFFKTLKQWLAAHPTEFCIVTIDLTATKDKTAWANEFGTLVNGAEYNGLFSDFKSRLTVGEMRGKVLMLSKWEYGAKPLGGYCYGWDSYLELEKQQQGYIVASDGSKTPLWVQDYWKDITRINKDQALIKMLEAAVARDMTASAPAWVINYPSAYIDGFFSDNYRQNAESANKKAIDWLDSHKGSVGIIYMDFAGMDKSPDYTRTKLYNTVGMQLVDRVIKQNRK